MLWRFCIPDFSNHEKRVIKGITTSNDIPIVVKGYCRATTASAFGFDEGI
jgi:hypothetical protein